MYAIQLTGFVVKFMATYYLCSVPLVAPRSAYTSREPNVCIESPAIAHVMVLPSQNEKPVWLPMKQKTVREQLLRQYLCVPAVLDTW